MDLQSRRGEEGISDRTLDERWFVVFRCCGVCVFENLLWNVESEDVEKWWEWR